MGNFDDIIIDESYEKGFEDGKKSYKEFVSDKISPFLDTIIDDEVNKILPRVNYEFTRLNQENEKIYRLYESLKTENFSLKQENIYLSKDNEKCREILEESRDEIIRLQKKCGE